MKRNIYYYYVTIKPHQQLRHPLIFNIFFSPFKLFFPPTLKKKENKKKKLFFSLLIHTYCYIFFSPTFSLPFCLFISPLLSTLPLHFLHLSYILTLLLLISFCINFISFSSFNPYFFPHICTPNMSE